MYSSFSYICLITLSKVNGIALRRRCDQSCCLGTVSYACEKSMKATCNLGLFLGFSFLAACLRCLRINRGCRVLLPGKKPNCVSGILPFFTHQSFTKSFSTCPRILIELRSSWRFCSKPSSNTRFQRKGLQSKRATASLLIINKKFRFFQIKLRPLQSIRFSTSTDKWLCLRTKKGLQGGKTTQQRSESLHREVPIASTISLAHALALSAHMYVCLLLCVYSALRGCHTAAPSRSRDKWLRQTSRPHCGCTLIQLNEQIESETLHGTGFLEDPL
jgi:hypothetical protein